MSTQIIAACIASASIASASIASASIASASTASASTASTASTASVGGTRFVRANGFEINALQGVFIVTGSGVEAGGAEALEVRVAEVRLCKPSRTGLTSWPALIEEGWLPGFRADQIPAPAELQGLDRFVVFPVGSTGHSDWQAEAVEVAEWAEAVQAWEAWRQQEGPLPSSAEGVWRMARNHTRTRGGWWTAQEVKDFLRYVEDAVLEDHGDEILFWSRSRSVCGRASSRILDPQSGDVAETWPFEKDQGEAREWLEDVVISAPEDDEY